MDAEPLQPSEGSSPEPIRKEQPIEEAPELAAVENSEPESDCESDDEVSVKSTRSCSPGTLRGIFENGRRYCDDVYFMPNDESELTRLNVVHQIYLILLDGRLTTAPLTTESPRILDVGTGPGDWAIEMNAEAPNATIIASDIGVFDSGIAHISLPNVFFQIADARSEWTYHEPFDLVHIRGLSGAFQDWSSVYRNAFAHLKPGGYIEVADADPAADILCSESQSDSSYLQIYSAALRAAGEASGYLRDGSHLRTSALTAAGFVDVRVLERTIPIGLWPHDMHEKTLGKMGLIALLEGLEAYALRSLTRSGSWSLQGATDLCEKVTAELLSADRLSVRVRIVTGRKPISYAQRKEEVLARAMRKAEMFTGAVSTNAD
ncbi:hypothetical protein N7474_008820 [Penicillium riverlandense]|uniref:uncharacterized protein n=1 Tax=Penicillium riverlandense TaxID=1903569 RepID=UPI00254684F3|nr:uncharacterized protein N7474_008820 [Penicillium riverlandense]KAJ5812519.1 hypothetical protein N7474_008820 [Penicillium riverlandense]